MLLIAILFLHFVVYNAVFAFAEMLIYLQASKNNDAPQSSLAHASSSENGSSNGHVAHEDGQKPAGLSSTTEKRYSRSQSIQIIIDPKTGEARNAATGETMEMPLQSPRPAPSTPPPVPITEFQQLATESDLKV